MSTWPQADEMLAAASKLSLNDERPAVGRTRFDSTLTIGDGAKDDSNSDEDDEDDDQQQQEEAEDLSRAAQLDETICNGMSREVCVATFDESGSDRGQDQEQCSGELSTSASKRDNPAELEHFDSSSSSSSGEYNVEDDHRRREQLISDQDYHPEREYFSDPDFHDERPGKRSSTTNASSSLSRSLNSTITTNLDSIAFEGSSFDESDGSQHKIETLEESQEVAKRSDDQSQTIKDDDIASESSSGQFEKIGGLKIKSVEVISLGPESSLSNRQEQDRNQVESCSNEESVDSQLIHNEAGTNPSIISEKEIDQVGLEPSLHGEEHTENLCKDVDVESDRDKQVKQEASVNSATNNDAEQCRPKVLIDDQIEAPNNNKEASNNEVDDENLVRDEATKLELRRQQIMELVSDYCDKLVELIKEEALKQVDFILASSKQDPAATTDQKASIEQLSISNRFESSSLSKIESKIPADKMNHDSEQLVNDQQVQKISCRRIYTSSLFYNDKQNSFPTIEEELDRCQTIVKQLEFGLDAPTNDICDETEELSEVKARPAGSSSCSTKIQPSELAQHRQADRASLMFKKRRERMRHYTIGSSYEMANLELDTISETCNDEDRPVWRRRTKSLCGPSTSLTNTDFLLESESVESRRSSSGLDQVLDERTSTVEAFTDTEYEAPRVARLGPRLQTETGSDDYQNRETRLSNATNTRPKYKPFLDSTTLKDVERLREWCPKLDFNQHQSVSPETCQKLVEDLKTGAVKDGSNEQRRSTNRGALLFERRQLQSSDWIVSSEANEQQDEDSVCQKGTVQEPDSSQENYNEEDEKSQLINSGETSQGKDLADDKTSFARDSIGGAVLSRPSIAEETVMVAENACQEQLVELAPLVLSHQQPQLELATVTRTPSFGTSSRRIVECDSPDDHNLSCSSSTSSVEDEQSSQEELDNDDDDDEEDDDNVDKPPQRDSEDSTRPEATLEACVSFSQPRIQLNDHDLVEQNDNGNKSSQFHESVAVEKLEQHTVKLMDDLAFGDGRDVSIGHKAVVMWPDSDTDPACSAAEDRQGSSTMTKRLPSSKLQQCTIETLPDWPQIQFASVQYYDNKTDGDDDALERRSEAAPVAERSDQDENGRAGLQVANHQVIDKEVATTRAIGKYSALASFTFTQIGIISLGRRQPSSLFCWRHFDLLSPERDDADDDDDDDDRLAILPFREDVQLELARPSEPLARVWRPGCRSGRSGWCWSFTRASVGVCLFV